MPCSSARAQQAKRNNLRAQPTHLTVATVHSATGGGGVGTAARVPRPLFLAGQAHGPCDISSTKGFFIAGRHTHKVPKPEIADCRSDNHRLLSLWCAQLVALCRLHKVVQDVGRVSLCPRSLGLAGLHFWADVVSKPSNNSSSSSSACQGDRLWRSQGSGIGSTARLGLIGCRGLGEVSERCPKVRALSSSCKIRGHRSRY